jgi:hypothetical protein
MNLLMDVSTVRQKSCRQEIQRDGARDKLVPKHTALQTHYAESTFNSSCESPCSEPDPQLRDLLSETLLNWFRDVTNPKPGECGMCHQSSVGLCGQSGGLYSDNDKWGASTPGRYSDSALAMLHIEVTGRRCCPVTTLLCLWGPVLMAAYSLQLCAKNDD